MADERIAQIEVANIRPSPYQHRRAFDEPSLRELANSIETDGLIQPITVRRVNTHFELIAGERRWRAVQQFTAAETIDARVLDVNDLQARRLCATENLQRSDLTALEEIHALAELVDASLLEWSDEYAPLATIQEPKWRVRALLIKLAADKAHGTNYVDKFIHKVEAVFSGLPKPKDSEAFRVNDLPLLFTPEEVQQFALDHRLNKSQTKAIDALQQAAPDWFQALAESSSGEVLSAIRSMARDPEEPPPSAETIAVEPVNPANGSGPSPSADEEVRDLPAETIRKAAKRATGIYAGKPLQHNVMHNGRPLLRVENMDAEQAEQYRRETAEAGRAAKRELLSWLLKGAKVFNDPADRADISDWKGTWPVFIKWHPIEMGDARNRLMDLQERIPFLINLLEIMNSEK